MKALVITPHYWRAYRKLEDELLFLADSIHFDDKQVNVYSFQIADLLTRCMSEYESIAKDLYRRETGHDSGNDTGKCFDYLDEEWELQYKSVELISDSMYFEKKFSGYFKPLGYKPKSCNDFYSAYNAIKHDRVKNVQKASIRILILAMAGLYLLNIYYYGNSFYNLEQSEIFSAKCAGESIGFAMDYGLDFKNFLTECPLFSAFSPVDYLRYSCGHRKEVKNIFNKATKRLGKATVRKIILNDQYRLNVVILKLIAEAKIEDYGSDFINATNLVTAGYIGGTMRPSARVNYGYNLIYIPEDKANMSYEELLPFKIADNIKY